MAVKEPAWLYGWTRAGELTVLLVVPPPTWPPTLLEGPAHLLQQSLLLCWKREEEEEETTQPSFGRLARKLRGASAPDPGGPRSSHRPARRRSSAARLASESAAANCSFSSKTSARKPGSASASLPAANSTPCSSSWEAAEGATQGEPRRPRARRPFPPSYQVEAAAERAAEGAISQVDQGGVLLREAALGLQGTEGITAPAPWRGHGPRGLPAQLQRGSSYRLLPAVGG